MYNISFKEKMAHAVGSIGHNLIYALFSGFLLIFYTDIFGLSAGFTGTLFLIARIWDAVDDPAFGLIADKTKAKIGRYRFWLMVSAPIIALALIGCFYVPVGSKIFQYIYCYVTYLLLGIAFSGADIPYWTLPSVMTDDPKERTKIFSLSSVFGSLASGIGAVITPIVVQLFPTLQIGYLVTASIFGAVGIITYYVCAINVRERIELHEEKTSLRKSLSVIFKNKPLVFIMASSVLGNLAFQIRVAANTHYGTYVLGSLTTVTYLSAMLLVGLLIGASIIPFLVKKIGAKLSAIIMLGSGFVFSMIYFFIGYSNQLLVYIITALLSVVVGAFAVLCSSMTSDSIDYAEFKLGERSEGLISSTRTFITKFATAVAGAIVAYALEASGYVPNVAQTKEVINTLQNIMSLIPAIIYLMGMVVAIFYPLDKKTFDRMEEELHNRREMAKNGEIQ